MSTPRSQLVDETITLGSHCVSRCMRRARPCGHDYAQRKDGIVIRLRELLDLVATHCGGFAVMDNHLHLLLRFDHSERTHAWSDEEVARRWLRWFPLRDLARRPLPVAEQRV